MPKIVVKVNRTATTRSKSLRTKEAEGAKSKSQTPNKRSGSPSQKPTNKKTASTSIPLAERRFFTVGEDAQILSYYKEHVGSMPVSKIASNLSKKLKPHSEESIRTRIRKELTKLREIDYKLLEDEVKVEFADLAPLLVFRPFQQNQRPRQEDHLVNRSPASQSGREHPPRGRKKGHPKRREKDQKTGSFKMNQKIINLRLKTTGRSVQPAESSEKSSLIEHYTTEELFRFRQALEEKERNKGDKYKVKLRKREPVRVKHEWDDYDINEDRERGRRREFFKNSELLLIQGLKPGNKRLVI